MISPYQTYSYIRSGMHIFKTVIVNSNEYSTYSILAIVLLPYCRTMGTLTKETH